MAPSTHIPSKRRKTWTEANYNPNTAAATQVELRQQVLQEKKDRLKAKDEPSEIDAIKQVIIQLTTVDGQPTGAPISIELGVTPAQLTELINNVLNQSDEPLPYSFYLQQKELTTTLYAAIQQAAAVSTENVIPVVYQPQALHRVRAVTRCTASLPGHSEPILHCSFSPDGTKLASGSGDSTVRIWDVLTHTPIHTLTGHHQWVLAVAWSADGKYLASSDMGGQLRIWDGETGELLGKKPLIGHKKPITCLSWQPLHLTTDTHCTRIATGSKDGDVRVWNVVHRSCEMILSGHTHSVTSVKWGGSNLLYSASQDRSIKVWDVSPAGRGKLHSTLQGHAHWVNHLALSTDVALRSGAYDVKGRQPTDLAERLTIARKKYDTACAVNSGAEILASCSDDFTVCLWNAAESSKPVQRMPGHQQPVNYVAFSPDGRLLASAGFDKAAKLWNAQSGQFIASLRGHVGAVYQVCFSSDSRLLVTSSKDSTIKLWDCKTKKMVGDLPGHADEVYACDWSTDGEKVASGGRDQVLKLWTH